jgi:Txe/YoeB family toxin of Txe-Axe toxin-antitoxin module
MGITLKSNGSKISLDGGYSMLYKIRCRIALAWDKEFGEHYAKLPTLYCNEDFKEFDKKTNKILQNERFKNEDSDLLEFLFASDCEGKCRPKTCKKIYDLIKNIHEENLQLRYAFYSKNDWEDFKQLLLDCYSHRANLTWS